MANNKVQLANGTVLIDLTDTTATAADVVSGKYFYAANGTKTLGTSNEVKEIVDRSIVTLNNSSITTVGKYALSYCDKLTGITLPNCTLIVDYGICHNSKLASVYLHKVGRVYTESLSYNPLLTSVALPALRYALTNALSNNTGLASVDLGSSCPSIAAGAFDGDSSLKTLVLRRTSVCGVTNINAFTGTPFASGGSGGTLYVPSSLISTYRSSTNWSVILGYSNNQIKAIETSVYATQYADGTSI